MVLKRQGKHHSGRSGKNELRIKNKGLSYSAIITHSLILIWSMLKKGSTKNSSSEDIQEEVFSDITVEDDSVSVSGKLKKLQKKLKNCEKERQDHLNGWQRARADAVNKDKDSLLERERAVSRAEINIFTSLLPILDSFDMAFSNKEAWEKVDANWRSGIEQIYIQAINIFEQLGVSVINTSDAFDPQKHETVQTEDVKDEKDEDSILSVAQKGYERGDIVLRPAKVIIGKFKI